MGDPAIPPITKGNDTKATEEVGKATEDEPDRSGGQGGSDTVDTAPGSIRSVPATPLERNPNDAGKPISSPQSSIPSSLPVSNQGSDSNSGRNPAPQSAEMTVKVNGPQNATLSTKPAQETSKSLTPRHPTIPITADMDPIAIAAAAAQVSFPDLYADGESLPEPPQPMPRPPMSVGAPQMSAATTTPSLSQHDSRQLLGTLAVTAADSSGQPPPSQSSTIAAVSTTATTDAQPTTNAQAHAAIQQDLDDAALEVARMPLTNMYGPYLSRTSDQTLADARKRLKTALAQTYGLRVAFTDRVYQKYRIRLKKPEPIEEIIVRIEKDPKGQLVKLRDEGDVIRDEKEIEKKEAIKLNTELAQTVGSDRSHVLANIDNAEQLMYMTAGLNLVILPEESMEGDEQHVCTERATGSSGRAKNLSQAATTAGEIILDRTRRASAMRVERQRQRQLLLLRGEGAADGEVESNYAAGLLAGSPRDKLPVVEAKKSAQQAFRRPSTAIVKANRSRNQQMSSTNAALLSLHPTADEAKTEGNLQASTIALIAKGVGTQAGQSMQQRLKHPHPESLGGLRRANINQHPPAPGHGSPQAAHVAYALPPLPVAKERLERKKVPLLPVSDSKARRSIHAVLREFMSDEAGCNLDVVSKIDLLNAVRKLDSGTKVPSQLQSTGVQPVAGTETPVAAGGKPSPLPDHSIYPFLTVSVFYALGLLTRAGPGRKSSIPSKIPDINPRNKALNSDRFKKLKDRLSQSSSTLTELMCVTQFPLEQNTTEDKDRPAAASPPRRPLLLASPAATQRTQQGPVAPAHESEVVPAQSIRGGGEVLSDQQDDAEGKRKNSERPLGSIASSATVGSRISDQDAESPSKKRRRASSSPTAPSNGQPAAAMHDISARSLDSERTARQTHSVQERGHFHHPAAGDLASYFGGLTAQQGLYDLPTFLATTPQGHLQSLGFGRPTGMLGFSLQEQATALLAHEHRTASLLGGYGHGAYAPVGHHHQSVPPFLGATTMPNLSSPQPTMFAPQLPLPSNVDSKHPAAKRPLSGREQIEAADQKRLKPSPTPPNPYQQSSTYDQTQQGSTQEKFPAKETQVSSLRVTSPQQHTALSVSQGLPSPLAVSSPLPESAKEKIRAGAFFLALEDVRPNQRQLALDFLLATGATVPIPNSLVAGPLKERLNTPGFKGLVSREIVSAAILTWLWHFHKATFREVFEKNGRIDVDANCKWLIQAAISTSMGELSLDIAESVARSEGAFAEAKQAATTGSIDRQASTTVALHTSTAATVSRSLNVKMRIDEGINSVLSRYEEHVDLLDEARMGALRSRTRERTFLMALMSQNTTISESLSNAFTSSLIRSSEAIGNDGLVDVCQDDEAAVSTMLPYDVLEDDNGAWEDPCKPSMGFTESLTGDELFRKAHARASVQKSLRRLQEKLRISGGTPVTGPYADPLDPDEPQVMERIGLSPRQIGGRRRASSMVENPVPPGTGSSMAWSWSVYDPKHFSAPLDWRVEDANNGPYGTHGRSRALSIASGKLSSCKPSESTATGADSKPITSSTREIDWVDIASTFQSVEIPKKRQRSVSLHDSHLVTGPIVAPFVQKLDQLGEASLEGEEESDGEENLSEEHFLASHKIVLEEMKTRLEAFFESRKKQPENRRNRNNK